VTAEDRGRAASLVTALGGPDNIVRAEPCALTRIRVEVRDGGDVNQAALEAAGIGGVLRVSDSILHLVIGERAGAVAAALDDELRAPAAIR
jgi:phosphotransferase system IIB component